MLSKALRFLCAFVLAASLAPPAGARSYGNPTWTVSYSAVNVNGVAGNGNDPNGLYIGATQVRSLVAKYYANGATMRSGVTCNSSNPTWVASLSACAGVLAGAGYWEDMAGPEGQQHAQVLALDTPTGKWYRDASLGNSYLGNGSNFAVVGEMYDHTFTTNCAGGAISQDVALAGTQGSGGSYVYGRVDSSLTWASNLVASGGGQQIRSLGFHVDTVTGIDTLYIGEDANGMYSACLNTPSTSTLTVNGLIPFCSVYNSVSQTCTTLCSPSTITNCTNIDPQWLGTGTFCTAAGVPNAQCQACGGGVFQIISCTSSVPLRVMAIADANSTSLGRHVLCASIGYQIWCVQDGASPFLYELGQISIANLGTDSQSGLRGLTSIPALSGGGQAYLSGTEGTVPNLYRITISTGGLTTLANFQTLYNSYCVSGVTNYRIDDYNNFAPMNNSWLAGQGTTDGTNRTVLCPSINWASGTGQFKNFVGQWAGVWVISGLSGTPTVNFIRIPNILPQYMVSTYTVLPSPFPSDAGKNCIYAAGFDPNSTPVHRTAWIIRGCGLPIP